MDTKRTVSIIAPAGGRKNYVANDVPVHKLAIYSQIARHRYFPGAGTKVAPIEGDRRTTSNPNEFDLGEKMSEEFARIVATHIKNSDSANPAPLTLALVGPNRSLGELVQIWRVIGQGYKCPRERHDESIRDDLRLKMYDTTPFLFSHFKLVVENLAFDRGIFHSALDRVAFLHIKGYLDNGTKMEIENYCKAHEGYWDSLLETVGRVETKINDAAAEKAAREKAREDKKDKQEKQGSRAGQSGKGKASKSSSSGGKAQTGKGKGKAPAKPFSRKDDDFPPLS